MCDSRESICFPLRQTAKAVCLKKSTYRNKKTFLLFGFLLFQKFKKFLFRHGLGIIISLYLITADAL